MIKMSKNISFLSIIQSMFVSDSKTKEIYPWIVTEDQETSYFQLQVPLAAAGLGGHSHPTHSYYVKVKGLRSLWTRSSADP